jgi:hypothetical protein
LVDDGNQAVLDGQLNLCALFDVFAEDTGGGDLEFSATVRAAC